MCKTGGTYRGEMFQGIGLGNPRKIEYVEDIIKHEEMNGNEY